MQQCTDMRVPSSMISKPAEFMERNSFMMAPSSLPEFRFGMMVPAALVGRRESHTTSSQPNPENGMLMPSTNPATIPPWSVNGGSNEVPDIYSQVGNDLDVCLDCYKRMSDGARRALGKLEPHSFQSRGFRPHEVTCDFCARKGHEFSAAWQQFYAQSGPPR